MNKPQFVRALTLWFVALTFLRTDSGAGDGALVTAAALLAILLSYGIPLFLAIGAIGNFVTET